MSNLLIILIVLLYSLQTLFCKFYTDRYPGNSTLASPVFCVLESIFIALFTWAARGFQFQLSWPTVLIGALNAMVLFGYNTSLIKASSRGSYAFMNVFMLFGGILVPIIYSRFFLNERPAWYQLAAISIMLLACLLMNLEEIRLKGASPVYYVFCLLLFLFNGLYGVLIKIQSVQNDNEKSEMIILTYGLMGVIALFQLLTKERGGVLNAFRMNKQSFWPLALCLLFAALAINALVYVIPMVNVAVLYTVDNGGVLMLAAVYAILFFKEKPTVLKSAGIVLALGSITVLSL